MSTTWDPRQYLRFKSERTQPSYDLVARLAEIDPGSIVDIGCGPGNSTAVLRQAFPHARILGIDSSPEMIDEAKNAHSDIDFLVFDATQSFDALPGPFDLVFSNACIQWIPDNRALIGRMMSIVSDGGTLAVQVPLSKAERSHLVIQSVVAGPTWRHRFPEPRIFHTLEPREYFDALSRFTDAFTMWQTTYFHRMSSSDDIVEWMTGTGLRPYLDQLPARERPAFLSDIRQAMRPAFPCQENGEVIMEFPRLFFTATKH